MNKRIKVDISRSWVSRNVIGVGVTLYVAFCNAWPTPIGFVWGVEFGGPKPIMQVWDSYIVPWARRSGVRTLINREILKYNDAIITGSRTKEGIAFMKARGYKYDKRLDQWSLVRKDQGIIYR